MRAMNITPAYWLAMLAASALGTNLGDLWGEDLLAGLAASLASLLVICAMAVWYDRRNAGRTEAGYWVAVVAMRAAATNLADMMTHQLALGYVLVSVVLAVLTLVAARFTKPDLGRGNSPCVDGAYWTVMFIAGLFGTVAGDLIDATVGLYAAAAALCTILAALIAIRQAGTRPSVLLFWSIVMVERCAGTALGDGLASHRAVGLGVPLATACTLGLTLLCLRWRSGLSGSRVDVPVRP